MGRKNTFTVPAMEKLVGKIARIGQAFRPIYHLMPHLYSSVAYGLRDNKSFLISTSAAFRKMIKEAKRDYLNATAADMREIKFAIGQSARMQHKCRKEYPMPPSLINELKVIKKLLLDKTIKLCTPLAHIVPRDYTFAARPVTLAKREGEGGAQTSPSTGTGSSQRT